MIISSSWDDGHRLDRKLADMLSHYGVKGTFYIARDFLKERLSDDELRELSQTHELGAHTLNHPILTEIPLDEAEKEISGSKQWLEELLGQPVTAFCYPKGASNAELEKLVEKAGYSMARGVEGYHLGLGARRYCIKTTLQIYPFPLRPLPNIAFPRGIWTRLQPLRSAWKPLNKMGIAWPVFRSWEELAIRSLEEAAKTNGIWHLWGHSWEIEDYGMWDSLERVLQAASQYKFTALSNSELMREYRGK
jgi:peptidoglycan/xylan/chitin deacetylase (PgdA/CDA1 family)